MMPPRGSNRFWLRPSDEGHKADVLGELELDGDILDPEDIEYIKILTNDRLDMDGFETMKHRLEAVRQLRSQKTSRKPSTEVAQPPTYQLKPRMRAVLILGSHGHTDPEIAALLYISVPTVKTHWTRIFAALGARNRTQATWIALTKKLIGAPPQNDRPHGMS